MNHHPSPRRCKVGALALVTALSATLLTACGSKPPGCADEKTIDAVRTTLLDRWKEVFQARGFASMFDLTAEQVANFNNALKLEIRDIVSEGYNVDAKRHACTGVFVFKTVTGATYTASRRFSSQAAAEGGGKFVVQIENSESLVNDLSDGVNSYKAALFRQGQSSGAKKPEVVSSPPPAERELSITPIAQATTDPSSPPASPTPQPQLIAPTTKAESQGPSFDCSKAATAVERAICGDPKLAELDVAVVNAYNVALSKLPNKQDARTEQGQWMRQVRNACTSVQCLTDAYQRRLAQLQ